MEKKDEKEIEKDFDEIKKKFIKNHIDKEGFERFEEWVEKTATYPIKKKRIVLLIQRIPFVLLFLIIFIISFSLPSIYVPYIATITAILTFLAIFITCPIPFPFYSSPPNLEDWLSHHQDVMNAINWVFGDTPDAKNYVFWGDSRKLVLQKAFESAWYNRVWECLLIFDPPLNVIDLADEDGTRTALDAIQAFSLYIAYVAHCLALQINRVVPWSILNYTQEGLRILLDGREMFKNPDGTLYYIYYHVHGEAIPAPPDFTYSFFKQNNFIEFNRYQTIVRIINWCRDNLVHFFGGNTAQNMEAQWQYRGKPPVSRIINGTISEYNPELGRIHITAGCWGTLGFLRSIFRAVNIPVKLKSHHSHAQVCFISESLYLSHGDDPYSKFSKVTPLPTEVSQLAPGESLLPPAEEILIDQTVYNEWYVGGDELVGRRPPELAIIYLPDYLLHWHCKDKEAGRSHEDSVAYQEFLKNFFSIEFLEEQRLWERMDEKIAAWGGCDALPRADEIVGTSSPDFSYNYCGVFFAIFFIVFCISFLF